MRELYLSGARASPRVFVNLDMEEYRDLELTLAVFMQVLDEPDLVGLDAGIVLQAYLPDSHDALERLASWAATRHERGGGRIKVRLVKGANLAMERVDAELHGWPQAPYATKPDVDASYKRLLDRALDPCWGEALRVGLASHNLFDVAWGVVRAERLGTRTASSWRCSRAWRRVRPKPSVAVRAASCCTRRWCGATSSTPRSPTWCAGSTRTPAPTTSCATSSTWRPAAPSWQSSATASSRRSRSALPSTRRPAGCSAATASAAPSTPRGRSATSPTPTGRAARTASGSTGRSRRPARSSRRCPSSPEASSSHRRRRRAASAVGIDPSAPDRPLYRHGLADRSLVQRAVDTALQAQPAWGATTGADRAALLARCAEVLASRRGDALAVMARDTGKTVGQGDPEVSEAVDMAAYDARQALLLDGLDARHEPLGPVVVAPPWNFPFAIPAGGVLAALAAGNTVILKPAPESVLTAWLLATCLWDAGVPARRAPVPARAPTTRWAAPSSPTPTSPPSSSPARPTPRPASWRGAPTCGSTPRRRARTPSS